MLPYKGVAQRAFSAPHKVNYIMQPVGYFQYNESNTSLTESLPVSLSSHTQCRMHNYISIMMYIYLYFVYLNFHVCNIFVVFFCSCNFQRLFIFDEFALAFCQVFRYLNASQPIHWLGSGPPIPEPPCGFTGEKCAQLGKPDWQTFIICTVSAAILMVAIGVVSRYIVIVCRQTLCNYTCLILKLTFALEMYFVRHYRYEQKLACLLWKVDIREVIFAGLDVYESPTQQSTPNNVSNKRSFFDIIGHGRHGNNNNSKSELCTKKKSSVFAIDFGLKRAYTRIGLFRGSIVAIKSINRKYIELTRNERKELKQVSTF